MHLFEKSRCKIAVFDLVEQMLKGSLRAMGQLITLVEYDSPGSTEALKEIYYHTKGAYVVGFTGAPGTGKSTLADQIAIEIRKRNFNVGIIAIDPSSPFTGGAFLGDRVRMINTVNHDDIYIRSMGTRGSLGGLTRATTATVKILDAFGKDFILIETCGAGQTEVDIVKEADTTVVVCVPGLGDGVQAMKAGIMEIGDIFVINKADLKDADRLVGEIETMLHMGYGAEEKWVPSVVKTIATEGKGAMSLVEKILDHREHLVKSGLLRIKRAMRIKQEILEIVKDRILKKINESANAGNRISDKLLDEIILRDKDPYTVAEEIIADHLQFS